MADTWSKVGGYDIASVQEQSLTILSQNNTVIFPKYLGNLFSFSWELWKKNFCTKYPVNLERNGQSRLAKSSTSYWTYRPLRGNGCQYHFRHIQGTVPCQTGSFFTHLVNLNSILTNFRIESSPYDNPNAFSNRNISPLRRRYHISNYNSTSGSHMSRGGKNILIAGTKSRGTNFCEYFVVHKSIHFWQVIILWTDFED